MWMCSRWQDHRCFKILSILWKVWKDGPVETRRKRGRLTRAKLFNAPFCRENYILHLNRIHTSKMTEYGKLNKATKKMFFDSSSCKGLQGKLYSFCVLCSRYLHVSTDGSTVNFIIGEIMSDSESRVRDIFSRPFHKILSNSGLFRGSQCQRCESVCS